MRRPRSTCRFFVAQLCLAALVVAQQAEVTAAMREAVANAQRSLRSDAVEPQLDGVRALAAIPRDRAQSRELGVVTVLAGALESPHGEVVDAALAALWADADHDGAVAVVGARLARLRGELLRCRLPEWGDGRRVRVALPRVPPLPPLSGDAQAKRRFKKALAEFERQQKADERERRQQAEELEDALARDAGILAAGAALAAFAGRLGGVRDDEVVDELLLALRTCLDRVPSLLLPIVEALCRTARRDAVAACVGVLQSNDAVTRGVGADRDRLLAHMNLIMLDAKKKELDPDMAAAPAMATIVMMRDVRLALTALGEGHGVAPPPTDATGTAADDAWQRWLDELSPKLPERVAPESPRGR